MWSPTVVKHVVKGFLQVFKNFTKHKNSLFIVYNSQIEKQKSAENCSFSAEIFGLSDKT